MVLGSQYKKQFSRAVRPLTRLLGTIGVTPNMMTAASLLLVLTAAFYLSQRSLVTGAVFFGMAALMDGLDGALAREKKRVTRWGEFFDAFSDRVVEAVAFIGIVLGFPELAALSLVAFALGYLISYSAARAEAWTLGKVLYRYEGLGSRAERLVILFAAMVLNQLYYGLLLLIAVSFIGVLQRLRYVRKVLK